MRFLHTMVRVRNLEESLDFWVTKFGLVEVRRQRRAVAPVRIQIGGQVREQVRDLGDPGRRQDVGDAGDDALAGLDHRRAGHDAEALAEHAADRVERSSFPAT